MTSFSERYGFQRDKALPDSGYGSEQNYAYIFGKGIVPYVKYNPFERHVLQRSGVCAHNLRKYITVK